MTPQRRRITFVGQQLTEIEDSKEQQSDSGQNLREGPAEQSPEGVQLLLRMRHVLQLSLGVFDALRHIAGEVLQEVRQAVLLRGSLACHCLVFGIGRDMAVGVQALDGPLGFVEDPASFFDQRTDFADKRFFVALIFRGPLGFVDFLGLCQCAG